MIQRLYIHNFRCLENFEFLLKGIPSALLIGKNGSGKSTISYALEVLQRIGRNVSRVGELIEASDFTRENTDIPIRFEIEVVINGNLYKYVLVLELPESFKEPRISTEQLLVDGKQIYSRQEAQVVLYKDAQYSDASFSIDWHLVALPIIQKRSDKDPVYVFQSWLARIIILSPIPSTMNGRATGSTLQPNRDASNFAEWLTGLLLRYPAAYSNIDSYIKNIIPDFDSIESELRFKDNRNIRVNFKKNKVFSIDFERLSDGEKCFFLSAVLIAINKHYEPLFCFWDEPDNYLSLSEVEHFVMELRRAFKNGGQLLVTSHNSQAIERFSGENTFFLDRKSHLEPTLIKLLDEPRADNLITSLLLGDIVI